jgi:hypothetical protein
MALVYFRVNIKKINIMKSIKTFLGLITMAFLSTNVVAQDMPQPSSAASFMQRVGVTDISMDYSRPRVKGREIWGKLVPNDEVWRTGANASTKIEFSTDVTIGGKEVKAGKYAIFMIPGIANWTIIISNYLDGSGTNGYTEASDVVRIDASTAPHSATENMLFAIDHITNNSCMVSMYWEAIQIGFVVEVNTNKYASVNLDKAVEIADGSFRTYNTAASYLLENDGDKKRALELAIKSTSQQKKFWNMTVLAEAYAANDDQKMAIKTAKEALEMSEKAEYMPYLKRNADNIAKWNAKK